jgi:hypothetical protein
VEGYIMTSKAKTQDLSEFYGIFNTMFKFVDDSYGDEELKKYWEFIGEKYFAWLIEDIKKRGIKAIEEYWLSTVENDDIVYDLKSDADKFDLKIDSCSAIGFIKKSPHDKLFPKYCEHCRVVNSKIAEQSGFEYKLDYDQEKGKCTHVFNK